MTKEISVDRETPLHACTTKNAAVTWPLPLDALVDVLVDLVEADHERTNRREVVAAIVYGAPRNGRQLSKLLRAYRAAKVADLTPAVDVGDNVAVFRSHRPGPRRRA